MTTVNPKKYTEAPHSCCDSKPNTTVSLKPNNNQDCCEDTVHIQPENQVPNPEESKSLLDSCICCAKDFFKSVFNGFSSLTSFLTSDGKKTVGELNDALRQVSTEGLSDESKAAYEKLKSQVVEMSSDPRYANMDISKLVSEWKNGNKNVGILFALSEKLKAGDCENINGTNLQHALIEGLESFGTALKELENSGASEEDKHKLGCKLREGAGCLVDNVGIVDKANREGRPCNPQEQEEIKDNMSRSVDVVEEINTDPELSRIAKEYIPTSFSQLLRWSEATAKVLEKLFEQREEERKEREEILAVRATKLEKFYSVSGLCAKYSRDMMNAIAAREKFKNDYYSLRASLERLGVMQDYKLDELLAKYLNNSDAVRLFSAKSNFYHMQGCEILDSLPAHPDPMSFADFHLNC